VLAGALAGILRDEQRHTSYTRELLVELVGERPARRAIRRAALRYAWRRWRRLGNGLARFVYTALMLLLYVLAAPLALLVRAVRPATSAWQPPATSGRQPPATSSGQQHG
jgi:hypothetical protein